MFFTNGGLTRHGARPRLPQSGPSCPLKPGAGAGIARGRMARILLISSLTATSHVGATVSAFVMRRLGVDVAVLPTTLFGRHPGWGAPGGTVTPPDTLRGMWEGVRAQIQTRGRGFDAVMTGYMGDADHVALAAEIIDALMPAHVLVDPVMGDWDEGGGRLYVPEARAEAICDQLVPRAHIVTPNSWEWRYITGSLAEGRDAPPRALAGTRETLVTSVEDGERIGAMLFARGATHRVLHDRYPDMPHGGGDALAADYLAQRVLGVEPETALGSAVSSVFAMMRAADAMDEGELPFVRAQATLQDAPPLQVETL